MAEKTKGKWRLCVRGEFSASHQLRHYKGKCENLHGHNFGVELEVEGDRLTEDTELLMDFKDVRAALNKALAPLDHCHLNDCPALGGANPSSENLARLVFLASRTELEGSGVRVVRATVAEKPGQSASYSED